MKVQWEKPVDGASVRWETPKKGTVGAPYDMEYWTYRVVDKFSGATIYAEDAGWITHGQGINKLLSLGTVYGVQRNVCGTYKLQYNFYTAGTTLCTVDGGVTYRVGEPPASPPNPTPPTIPPIDILPIFPVARSRFAPFFGPFAAPTLPFFPTYVRRVTWTAPSPIAIPLFTRPYTVRWSVSGPNGMVGAPCDDVKNAIANQEAARSALLTQLSAINKAYNEAVAAQNEQAVADLHVAKNDVAKSIQEIDANLIQLKAVLTQCQNPPTPGCTSDADCGAAGFKCENGNCVPWDCFKDGDCPAGQKCVNGVCVPNPAASSGEGTPWGLFALGAAAVGAFFIGLKPPNLPRSESGRALSENPRRRRRRRRGY